MDTLVTLTDSGYCYHKSWGFGKITTVDTVFSRFVIDFQTKSGHAMDLAFAAASLKAIPKEHIYARKVSDLEALRQMAALHHLDLIKLVLQSFGGRATVDQVQQALVPDVITRRLEEMVGSRQARTQKRRPFPSPSQKIRTDHLPSQGSFAAEPVDGGIPRRQGV